MYRKCISVHCLLKASALCACLPCICCFLTVGVRRREWRWKAAIFIQCLCEPYAAHWLNACHIDTPVVPPVAPQRHNGVGIGEAPVCPWPLDSATRRLGCIRDAFVSSTERNIQLFKGLVQPNAEHRASAVDLELILESHVSKEILVAISLEVNLDVTKMHRLKKSSQNRWTV